MRADADLWELDLYAMLGVPVTARPEEIRAAHRRRARLSHPDLNPLDPASGARMVRLNRAVRLLLDPSRRAAYDRSRGAPAPVRGAAWYDRAALGNDWDLPPNAAKTTSVAARRFRRRVRRSGDVLALNTAEWLLRLGHGERLLLAGFFVAAGAALLMWSRPVNAFWTSPVPSEPAISERLPR